MKFSESQIKTCIKKLRARVREGWNFMVPEVRRAMVAQEAVGLLMSRDGQPSQVATSEDVHELLLALLKEAEVEA